jgi:hypothetical protein
MDQLDIQTKQSVLTLALESGPVEVVLDARVPGVTVPAACKANYQLVLRLDYMFQIPDLRIEEDRLVATLSFNRKPHHCVVPFDAVWSIRTVDSQEDEAIFYVESMPSEIISRFLSDPDTPQEFKQVLVDHVAQLVAQSQEKQPATPVLQLVPSTQSKTPTNTTPPKKGHLRLIKPDSNT